MPRMSTGSTDGTAEVEAVAALERAADRLDEAEAAVAEFGETELEELASAHEEFTGLLDRYEEPATGDGDFEQFIEFQGRVADFVERLPEDLLLRETFEECDDQLQQRRLTADDFAYVREQLEPVADLAARIEERRAAREAFRRARGRVRERRRELGDRIRSLERLQELGEADLDAPTERLREPVERYNRTVTDAFETFRTEQSARTVLELVAATEQFPLVRFETPPADLRNYVRNHEAGAEPIPKLLEYADYSRSKLAHYVADADALKQAVATRQTYLRRLDAGPLTVSWPPPSAGELRYRCRELTSVLDRFAPDAVADLRTVTALSRREDYGRLRESAVANAELSGEERERLRSGAVEEDLAAARAERERLTEALAAHER
ncbi:MAG: hypothetical protein ABEH56_02780 [Salinirussus sp.]